MSATEVLTLRLPTEVGARLSALAEQTHRTKAFYARQAIEAHLEDLEDYYLAAQAAQEFHASGETAQPLSALADELGIDLEMTDAERNQLLAEIQ